MTLTHTEVAVLILIGWNVFLMAREIYLGIKVKYLEDELIEIKSQVFSLALAGKHTVSMMEKMQKAIKMLGEKHDTD